MKEWSPIPWTGSNNYSKSAKDVRDDFKEYLNSQQGAVSWQIDMVIRSLHTLTKSFNYKLKYCFVHN